MSSNTSDPVIKPSLMVRLKRSINAISGIYRFAIKTIGGETNMPVSMEEQFAGDEKYALVASIRPTDIGGGGMPIDMQLGRFYTEKCVEEAFELAADVFSHMTLFGTPASTDWAITQPNLDSHMTRDTLTIDLRSIIERDQAAHVKELAVANDRCRVITLDTAIPFTHHHEFEIPDDFKWDLLPIPLTDDLAEFRADIVQKLIRGLGVPASVYEGRVPCSFDQLRTFRAMVGLPAEEEREICPVP